MINEYTKDAIEKFMNNEGCNFKLKFGYEETKLIILFIDRLKWYNIIKKKNRKLFINNLKNIVYEKTCIEVYEKNDF